VSPDENGLRRLMALAQQGDRIAYRALLEACQIWLRRYFARRVPQSQLDDLVQETLVSLHVKRATYDPALPFLPWMAAIARYRWVDHLRRVYRLKETALDAEPEEPQEPRDPHLMPSLARVGLDRMLIALPARQAEAIRLTKIEELTVAEASAQSGQSMALIKINVHRGMKRLHQLIERA
jgi:RNA polymerase sigma-70 factor (ECF subfamily)